MAEKTTKSKAEASIVTSTFATEPPLEDDSQPAGP